MKIAKTNTKPLKSQKFPKSQILYAFFTSDDLWENEWKIYHKNEKHGLN